MDMSKGKLNLIVISELESKLATIGMWALAYIGIHRGGTGVVETTIFLCNSLSTGTCRNATEYVFWDVVHPSEAANKLLINSLLLQGIGLIT
ncbi:hypothetical protein Dimus_029100 [Dionaea muscipula]